ncbi:recombinase family protein, partial [Picosynechococcus sp. PCC 7002]|uniref:recombinase family protein n=1 Tax=Picosynechococcus sp. (strain ATCC 27264 / PCC 7002 / PR-6) TaxID=32049 RepID=UPI0020CAF363
AMKDIGYIRVSTEEQATQGVSLDAQKAKLEAYAGLYDIELVDIVIDAGQSAKSIERPGLQKALGMLDSGEVEAMVIVKLDRLTRSVKDLDWLLENFFADKFSLMS